MDIKGIKIGEIAIPFSSNEGGTVVKINEKEESVTVKFHGGMKRTYPIDQVEFPGSEDSQEIPVSDVQRAVSTQKHYMQFEIQPIEFCQKNKLGWCESNVIKYVCRHALKNGIEDLHKAQSYLKTLIHYKETGKFETPDKL